MKFPSLIIFIFGSFCLTFCFDKSLSINSFSDIKKIVDKTGQGAIKLIAKTGFTDSSILDEAAKVYDKAVATVDGNSSGLYESGAKVVNQTMGSIRNPVLNGFMTKSVEGEKLFLQRNCIAHKFSRQSLSKYHNIMVDHPYQCETLNKGTDEFSRIIGCEAESKNFICYGISKTDPLPEPDEDGNSCYEVVNLSYESPNCRCPGLLFHAGIHAISFLVIFLFLIVFCCQCRNTRRVNRKQPEDIDFDFVKHNRSNLSR